MDIDKIVSSLDHTLLNVNVVWDQIKALCDEAAEFHTASVCIPPAYAKETVNYLNGRVPVCVVVGFPNGYSTAKSKADEAKEAVDSGVSEIDMVINIGFLKSGRIDEVRDEIIAVKRACGERILKVIIETCQLTDEEKIKACHIVTEAGADYIKTSTGFSKAGATYEDAELLVKNIGSGVKVKAAGGIHTLEEAQHYLDIGVSRIGSSSIIKLLSTKNCN